MLAKSGVSSAPLMDIFRLFVQCALVFAVFILVFNLIRTVRSSVLIPCANVESSSGSMVHVHIFSGYSILGKYWEPKLTFGLHCTGDALNMFRQTRRFDKIHHCPERVPAPTRARFITWIEQHCGRGNDDLVTVMFNSVYVGEDLSLMTFTPELVAYEKASERHRIIYRGTFWSVEPVEEVYFLTAVMNQTLVHERMDSIWRRRNSPTPLDVESVISNSLVAFRQTFDDLQVTVKTNGDDFIIVIRESSLANEGKLLQPDCSVCLESLSNVDRPTTFLQCRHGFHRDCIMTWFKEQATCPSCRRDASSAQKLMALKQ